MQRNDCQCLQRDMVHGAGSVLAIRCCTVLQGGQDERSSQEPSGCVAVASASEHSPLPTGSLTNRLPFHGYALQALMSFQGSQVAPCTRGILTRSSEVSQALSSGQACSTTHLKCLCQKNLHKGRV